MTKEKMEDMKKVIKGADSLLAIMDDVLKNENEHGEKKHLIVVQQVNASLTTVDKFYYDVKNQRDMLDAFKYHIVHDIKEKLKDNEVLKLFDKFMSDDLFIT